MERLVLPQHGLEHVRGGPDPTPHVGAFEVLLYSDDEALEAGVHPEVSLVIPPDLNEYWLTECGAAVFVTSSSGDVELELIRNRAGSTAAMLADPIVIDQGELDSWSSTDPPVIGGSSQVLTGDRIQFDLDLIGSGALGLKATLLFEHYPPS